MIHPKEEPSAAMFEHVILPDADGSYTTRLFAVEGKPGIWKRVPKADAEAERAIEARYDGGTIYLVRAGGIEEELKEAGFHLPQMEQERVAEDQEAEIEAPALKPSHARRLHA